MTNHRHASIAWSRHALAWVFFVCYESGSVYLATGKAGQLLDYLLFYLLNIGLFYLHALVVLPLAYRTSRYFYPAAVLLIMAELIAYLLAKCSIDLFLEAIRTVPHKGRLYDSRYLIINTWRGLYFLGFGTIYWSIRNMILFREKVAEAENRHLNAMIDKAELEREFAETRNAYLQQQINPHFLFNMLNLIYNSFYRFSRSASECVAKLADVMRYTYEETDLAGKTLLSAEIEQIENLIELNRLRFDFKLFIELEVMGIVTEQRILRLILLSLTENVFKHGNLKDKDRPARLVIETTGDEIRFLSKNLKKWRPETAEGTRMGLANISKRLDHAYAEKYRMQIVDGEEFFEVNLIIRL